jgi:hypothetical protein
MPVWDVGGHASARYRCQRLHVARWLNGRAAALFRVVPAGRTGQRARTRSSRTGQPTPCRTIANRAVTACAVASHWGQSHTTRSVVTLTTVVV